MTELDSNSNLNDINNESCAERSNQEKSQAFNKKHPRKKDNGKPQADECDSVTHGHLRFFNALYFLREYNVNGGFN